MHPAVRTQGRTPTAAQQMGSLGPAMSGSWRDGPDGSHVPHSTQLVQRRVWEPRAWHMSISQAMVVGPSPCLDPSLEQSPRQDMDVSWRSVMMKQGEVLLFENLTSEVQHSRPRPQKYLLGTFVLM